MRLVNRIGGNSLEVTKAEIDLHNKLRRSRRLARMSAEEVANLDTASPFIGAVAGWNEAKELAVALLKVAGLPSVDDGRTVEICALVGLQGIMQTQPQWSTETAQAALIASRSIEDDLIKAIDRLPVPRPTARARAKHQRAVTSAVDHSVRLFTDTPDHEHFVDNYYLQADLYDPNKGVTTLPGGELVERLVKTYPEVIEPFSQFRGQADTSSRDVASLAARVVLDAALAQAIDEGPFASQVGPEANSRTERSLRHLIFVTQRHALERTLGAQTSLAG